jgi:hypothetical protein
MAHCVETRIQILVSRHELWNPSVSVANSVLISLVADFLVKFNILKVIGAEIIERCIIEIETENIRLWIVT